MSDDKGPGRSLAISRYEIGTAASSSFRRTEQEDLKLRAEKEELMRIYRNQIMPTIPCNWSEEIDHESKAPSQGMIGFIDNIEGAFSSLLPLTPLHLLQRHKNGVNYMGSEWTELHGSTQT
jgi:hypothetical protein